VGRAAAATIALSTLRRIEALLPPALLLPLPLLLVLENVAAPLQSTLLLPGSLIPALGLDEQLWVTPAPPLLLLVVKQLLPPVLPQPPPPLLPLGMEAMPAAEEGRVLMCVSAATSMMGLFLLVAARSAMASNLLPPLLLLLLLPGKALMDALNLLKALGLLGVRMPLGLLGARVLAAPLLLLRVDRRLPRDFRELQERSAQAVVNTMHSSRQRLGVWHKSKHVSNSLSSAKALRQCCARSATESRPCTMLLLGRLCGSTVNAGDRR